jgi:IrrE N-terminal-like domain
MRSIRYANRVVALCEHDHVLLAPEIAALEPDHPTRRFVSMLCIYSAEQDARAGDDHAGCYSTAAAERFARAELMPDEAFLPLAHWADHQLAEAFIVPLEHIGQRRRDIRRSHPDAPT